MKNEKVEQPSVLAFERKLSPSDGLMYAGNWEQRGDSKPWQPLSIRKKGVRGTISNRQGQKESDPLKLEAKIDKPNLQQVDVAALPNGCDTLRVSFTLRALGDIAEPTACNRPIYERELRHKVQQYLERVGLRELARRYSYNIANGRFLWRNRLGAEKIEVQVRHEGKVSAFDAFDFDVRNFNKEHADLDALASLIEKGLSGAGYAFIEVDAFCLLGAGQEIFPSQEWIPDSKEKILYAVDGVAAMHSQKIGNAIRSIDTWHDEAADVGPISIEPYGSVTSSGRAYRAPSTKRDFYSLLDGWMLRDKEPSIEDQHFVIANLIRGGVFGESEKEK